MDVNRIFRNSGVASRSPPRIDSTWARPRSGRGARPSSEGRLRYCSKVGPEDAHRAGRLLSLEPANNGTAGEHEKLGASASDWRRSGDAPASSSSTRTCVRSNHATTRRRGGAASASRWPRPAKARDDWAEEPLARDGSTCSPICRSVNRAPTSSARRSTSRSGRGHARGRHAAADGQGWSVGLLEPSRRRRSPRRGPGRRDRWDRSSPAEGGAVKSPGPEPP